jgi:hypothetical protein
MAKEAVTVVEAKNYTTYAVVVFPDLGQVVAEVNALKARGWQPIGGVQISAQGSNVYHYQAMVK